MPPKMPSVADREAGLAQLPPSTFAKLKARLKRSQFPLYNAASSQRASLLSAETFDWDVVSMHSYPAVNYAIALQGSSPPHFSAEDDIDDNHFQAGADFSDWQLTQGGDGNYVHILTPFTSAKLSFNDMPPIEIGGGYAVIEVQLHYVDADAKGALPLGHIMKNLVTKAEVEPDGQYEVAVVKIVYDEEPTVTVSILFESLFTLWLQTSLNEFSHTFLTVEINPDAVPAVHGVFHSVWLAGWGGWSADWAPSAGWFGFKMSTATVFILLTNFSIMLFFARRKERREHFRRFYTVHIIGAVIFFSLLFVHGLFYTEPETYKWILGPLIIYLADRRLRYFRTKSSKVTITNDNFHLKGHGIIALKFPKPFQYRAGQYAELQIPAINREWHPFTIASAPHEDEMHFFIKSLGDWTNALEDLLKARLEDPEKAREPLSIGVMGPYGSPAQHVRSYDRVILVSGGVGSTPFSSICKHLHHLQVTKEKPVVDSRTDTAALYNVNRRLLEKLADLYNIDLKDLCKPVSENKDLIKGQHLINMANTLGVSEDSISSLTEGSANSSGEVAPDQKMADETNDSGNQVSSSENGSPPESNASSPPPPAAAYDDMEAGLFKHVGSVFYDVMSPEMAKKADSMPQTATGSLDKLREEQKEKHTMKGRLTSLYAKRSKLLAFAHTTRVSFTMLLSLLIRGTLICIGLIIGSISLSDGAKESADWLITTDTILGILLACQVTGTVFLELSYMGKSFFTSLAKILDITVLVPLVILSTAYGIRTWASDDNIAAWYIIVHFFVVLPLQFLMLGYRLYRSVGSHTLLRTAPSAGKYKKIVPAVDFMWTTPRQDDDKWLGEELNPLASGSELRLHRFVTRAKDDELTREEGYISSTKSGRPQWDELLQQVTLETPSNKEVSVFFCGPKPMGSALEKALRKIEILSNLRAACLHGIPRTVIVSEMQLNSVRTIDLLKTIGCNIRFMYREENFGY